MRSRVVTLVAFAAVAGCGGGKSQAPAAPLRLEASPSEIPADGITTTTITVSNSTGGSIVLTTSLGTLQAGDGQSGQRVTLAQNGSVMLRSACDATVETGCSGRAWIGASDAARAAGTAWVDLTCEGSGCMVAVSSGGTGGSTGGGSSGGGSGSYCTGTLESECEGNTSGFVIHYATGGAERTISGSDVLFGEDSGVRLGFTYAPDGASQRSALTFVAPSALDVGSYTDGGSEDPPQLWTFLWCTGEWPAGGFGISKLDRSSGDLVEFTATFEEHCEMIETKQYMCGCVHWVR